jgi:hypothetical protein
MENLKSTTDLVKRILEEVPETRSDDMLLYYRVCEAKNRVSLGLPFGMVLVNMKDFKLPSFKSVERCRRKLQRAYPELSANEEVETLREVQEEKYIGYARKVNV